jgi:hypothetical protein
VVPIACDIAWYRTGDLYRNYSDKATPSRFPAILEEQGLLSTTAFVELHPGDELDPVSGAVRRRFGELNWKGFRRRLKSKSTRFAPLAEAFDTFQSNAGFDDERYRAFIRDARAYFPKSLPVDATVRIDLVVVGPSGEALRRLAFAVSSGRLDISDSAVDAPGCDQEIIIPSAVWNACYGGRMLRRDLFGICLNRQIEPFRFEVAVLRYFMSYYLDLGDISPWARISGNDGGGENLELMRQLDRDLAPQLTVEALRDEYRA